MSNETTLDSAMRALALQTAFDNFTAGFFEDSDGNPVKLTATEAMALSEFEWNDLVLHWSPFEENDWQEMHGLILTLAESIESAMIAAIDNDRKA